MTISTLVCIRPRTNKISDNSPRHLLNRFICGEVQNLNPQALDSIKLHFCGNAKAFGHVANVRQRNKMDKMYDLRNTARRTAEKVALGELLCLDGLTVVTGKGLDGHLGVAGFCRFGHGRVVVGRLMESVEVIITPYYEADDVKSRLEGLGFETSWLSDEHFVFRSNVLNDAYLLLRSLSAVVLLGDQQKPVDETLWEDIAQIHCLVADSIAVFTPHRDSGHRNILSANHLAMANEMLERGDTDYELIERLLGDAGKDNKLCDKHKREKRGKVILQARLKLYRAWKSSLDASSKRNPATENHVNAQLNQAFLELGYSKALRAAQRRQIETLWLRCVQSHEQWTEADVVLHSDCLQADERREYQEKRRLSETQWAAGLLLLFSTLPGAPVDLAPTVLGKAKYL
jgi:hypothetical protein